MSDIYEDIKNIVEKSYLEFSTEITEITYENKEILEEIEIEKDFDIRKIDGNFDIKSYKDIAEFYFKKKYYRETLYFLEQGVLISENNDDRNYFISKIGNIANLSKDINLCGIFISFIFKGIPIITNFTCQSSGSCCKMYNINVTFSDIFKILKNRKDLNINDFIDLKEDFLLNNEENKGKYYFYLKKKKNSSECTFLDEKGKCSIHSFKPTACSVWPFEINENKKLSMIFSNFIPENTCLYKLSDSNKYDNVIDSLKYFYYNNSLSSLFIDCFRILNNNISEKDKYEHISKLDNLYSIVLEDFIYNKDIFEIKSILLEVEDEIKIVNIIYTENIEKIKNNIENKCLKNSFILHNNDNNNFCSLEIEAPFVSMNIAILDKNIEAFDNHISEYYIFRSNLFKKNTNFINNLSNEIIIEILISLRKLIKYKRISNDDAIKYISIIEEKYNKDYEIEKQLIKIKFLLYKENNLNILEEIINSKSENNNILFFNLKKAELFFLKKEYEEFENLLIDIVYNISNNDDTEEFLKHISKYKSFKFSQELNNFILFSCIEICENLLDKKDIKEYLFFSNIFLNRLEFDNKEESLLDNELLNTFLKEIIEKNLLLNRKNKVIKTIEIYLDYFPDNKIEFYLYLGDIFSEYSINDLSIEYYNKSLELIDEPNLFLSINYSIFDKLFEDKKIKELELLKKNIDNFIKKKNIDITSNIALFKYILLLYKLSRNKEEPLHFFAKYYYTKNFNKLSNFILEYLYEDLLENEYTIIPKIESLIYKIDNYYSYMAKSYIYRNKVDNFFKIITSLISSQLFLDEKENYKNIISLDRIQKEVFINMKIYIEIKDYKNALKYSNKLINLNNKNELKNLFLYYYFLINLYLNGLNNINFEYIKNNNKNDISHILYLIRNIYIAKDNKDTYLSKTFSSYLIDIFLDKLKNDIKNIL